MPDGDKKVEVLFQDENFWLTQKAIARLLGVEVPAISKHLGNIYETGELEREATLSFLETTAADGKTYNAQYYNPDIHHRRSIRLKGYDYSQAGAYFVTICTQNREYLFGHIMDGEMVLNDAGRFVADEWVKSAKIRHEIELDEFVVMPNHFHGIIVICSRGTACRAPTVQRAHIYTTEQFGKPVPGSLPTIIRSFKSAVTKRINEMRYTPGAKLWQRNYYEHIVRNHDELNRIREYIMNNPLQ